MFLPDFLAFLVERDCAFDTARNLAAKHDHHDQGKAESSDAKADNDPRLPVCGGKNLGSPQTRRHDQRVIEDFPPPVEAHDPIGGVMRGISPIGRRLLGAQQRFGKVICPVSRIEASCGCVAGKSHAVGSNKIDCRRFAKKDLLLLVEKITSYALPLFQTEGRLCGLHPSLQIRGRIERASNPFLESCGQIRGFGAGAVDRGLTLVEDGFGDDGANGEDGRRAERSDTAFERFTGPAPVLVA